MNVRTIGIKLSNREHRSETRRWSDRGSSTGRPCPRAGSIGHSRLHNPDELSGMSKTFSPSHTLAFRTELVPLSQKMIRRSIYDGNTTLYSLPPRQLVDQCIEKIRQDLLCQFEPTPFLEVSTNLTSAGKVPSIWTRHFCRDYSRIAEWAEGSFVRDGRAPREFIELQW